MDLCLAEDWMRRAGGAFRDDLGPQSRAVARPKHYVCGVRDWRAEAVAQLAPRRAPPALVRWHAPEWLRGEARQRVG